MRSVTSCFARQVACCGAVPAEGLPLQSRLSPCHVLQTESSGHLLWSCLGATVPALLLSLPLSIMLTIHCLGKSSMSGHAPYFFAPLVSCSTLYRTRLHIPAMSVGQQVGQCTWLLCPTGELHLLRHQLVYSVECCSRHFDLLHEATAGLLFLPW